MIKYFTSNNYYFALREDNIVYILDLKNISFKLIFTGGNETNYVIRVNNILNVLLFYVFLH